MNRVWPHISGGFRFCAVLGVAAVLSLVSGCTPGNSIESDRRPQLVASPDKATMMLAEAADKASSAIETLAAVEQARTPKASVTPIANVPPRLGRAMTISWVGPVEPVTKQLADRAGYNFLSVGSPPPVPIVVSLDVENQPVIDILRSLGLQLGPRADLKVDANREVVEIHYAPSTAAGTSSATTMEVN